MRTAADRIAINGYTVVEGCLDFRECQAWIEIIENSIENSTLPGPLRASTGKSLATYGARNLLEICPDVVRMLDIPVLARLIRDVLGGDVGVVRGLYFDKPPGTSWSLPWHQDLTIAVAEHITTAHHVRLETSSDSFSKPTVKAGICHVEAPTWLLRSMLTVRIHLDAMHAKNGPVLVRRGSHAVGKLTQGEQPPSNEMTQILCPSGSAMVMRPLLSHSSIACIEGNDEHRRTVHLELSMVRELPQGYRWHTFVQVA